MTDDDVQPVVQPDSEPDGPGIRDLLSLGGMLIGAVVVGVAIGLFADAQIGSSPVGVLVGTAVGIVAAGFGFWARVRVYLRGR